MAETLYLLPLSEAEALSEAWGEANFPKRMERVRRFRQKEAALHCFGAGALLCGVLRLPESSLCFGKNGKPYVPSGPSFSLSHSGNFVLLAVSDAEIGADIEAMQARRIRQEPRLFRSEESAWMQEEPETRFFRLWTMKESVMKQCGQGLALPPASFSVLPLLQGEALSLSDCTLFGQTLLYETHCLALCAPHPLSPLQPILLTAADLKNAR